MIASLLLAASTGSAVTFDISGGRAQPCGGPVAGDIVVCARTARPNALPILVDGVAARLLVEPGGPRFLVCDPTFALRAGLTAKADEDEPSIGRIGPEQVAGGGGRFLVVIDGRRDAVRVVWPKQSFMSDADCWAGPAVMPQPVVRFLLGAPDGAPRSVILPEYDAHHGSRDSATDAKLMIGRVAAMVRFDALNPHTALTAPAALVISRAGSARLEGATLQTVISYGISRPIRRLRTATPLMIGPLRIDALYARVSDYADASGIHATDPGEFSADDIVVNAGREPIEGAMIVRVGSDDLARCQSIMFDRRVHRITLTC